MRTMARLGLAMVVALCSTASARGEERAPYVFERVATAASMSAVPTSELDGSYFRSLSISPDGSHVALARMG
jgi:hypothetical protein